MSKPRMFWKPCKEVMAFHGEKRSSKVFLADDESVMFVEYWFDGAYHGMQTCRNADDGRKLCSLWQKHRK